MLRLAVGAMTSPATTFDSYVGFKEYLERKLDGRVTLVLRRSYREVNELLVRGEADVAFVCSGAYVKLATRHVAEILVVPRIAGHTTYRSLIIVRNGLDVGNFAELRGRRFAFTDPDSNTGRFYPTHRARELGLDPATFFTSTVYTHGHDNSIAAVRSGRVDAAAIDSLVFDYFAERDPDRIAGIQILERSPEYGIPPVVVRSAVDPALRERVRTALLEMPLDALGRGVLGELRIETFVSGHDEMYQGVREILRSVPESE